MNRFFDFTDRQLRFVVVMSVSALVLGVISFARHLSTPSPTLPAFQITVGDNESVFTGVFTLDPNTAPIDSLELLPGIGPVLAQRIVDYRSHQRFEETVDITEVRGIGPRLYERLRPYLRIAPW
jgi:DNA uptake protein ComE-like DNA-binding protein